VVSELISCLYISGKRSEEEKEHSDTHQVVSERDFHLYIVGGRRQSTGGLCNNCLQVGSSQEDSQEDCKMRLETLLVQSDSRIARRGNRDSKMATEGHRKKSRAEELTEMDEELADIKREMEELELKMRKNKKSRWVHEWPMKEPKMKWPVRELMARRQRRLLRRWLRYVENLGATEEEELVHICEPETGGSLNDLKIEMGSSDDLKNCQMGREEEIPDFQEGNELRSAEDLMDC
jgi:hypothetical protein